MLGPLVMMTYLFVYSMYDRAMYRRRSRRFPRWMLLQSKSHDELNLLQVKDRKLLNASIVRVISKGHSYYLYLFPSLSITVSEGQPLRTGYGN